MTKKKLQTLPSKHIKKLKKDRRLRKLWPLLLFLVGVGSGLLLAWLQPPDLHPKNLIWGADSTVQVPGDLAEFLRTQDDCQSYRGSSNPRGVGLWGVYQVSQDRVAKISYGCGYGLTRYIVAVKENYRWQLLPPADYFAKQGSNFLPNCSFVDRYAIDRTVEPFCIEADGSPRENQHQ